jgi:hypothetical protein
MLERSMVNKVSFSMAEKGLDQRSQCQQLKVIDPKRFRPSIRPKNYRPNIQLIQTLSTTILSSHAKTGFVDHTSLHP